MSDVNLQLVREFFELSWFRVLTNWQQDQRGASDSRGQIFIENCRTPFCGAVDFDGAEPARGVLEWDAIVGISRAAVAIRGWHGERFYPSVIEASPILSQFAKESSLTLAREVFGDKPFRTLLVISELPVSAELRAKSVRMLNEEGVDYILEFSSLLEGLVHRVCGTEDYSGSQTLQLIRLLKRYRMLRHQQLEFSFSTEPPVASKLPSVETTIVIAPDSEEG